MPMLRRHRRPRDRFGRLRGRAGQRRKRRNLVKFIPEADSDFALVARQFAYVIMPHPQRFGLDDDDAARIAEKVNAFRQALAKTSHRFTCNPQLVMAKDTARAEAEKIVRKYANIIRANPDVSDSDKKQLRIKIRPTRLGKRTCPKYPPTLMFLGSGDGVVGGVGVGSGSGVHVLKYVDNNEGDVIQISKVYGMQRRAKPDGAVRVELYFDMIPVGEPVPMLPGERGWPKYLRSFTRSPIEVQFPLPSEPMLIVYWAKWADSTGETSRWSKPCIARVEGWTSTARTALPGLPANLPALPASQSVQHFSGVQTKYVYVQTPIAGELPASQPLPEQLRQMLSGHLLEGEAEPMPPRKQLPEGAGAA